jgi:hypothetical protein
VLAVVAGAGAQGKPLRPFTFILDFLPYGEYTPYFTALDKGWYRDEGLDVKILRGAGSGDTIKRIAVGQGEVGSANFSALVGAKANEDIKVRAIEESIRRFHGVEGERIAAVGASLTRPAGAEAIDATGCLVLPGLVNAHTHGHNNLLRGQAGRWTPA